MDQRGPLAFPCLSSGETDESTGSFAEMWTNILWCFETGWCPGHCFGNQGVRWSAETNKQEDRKEGLPIIKLSEGSKLASTFWVVIKKTAIQQDKIEELCERQKNLSLFLSLCLSVPQYDAVLSR